MSRQRFAVRSREGPARHLLLWWLSDDKALPARAAEVIADSGTVVLVSAASIWEIVIKKAVGRPGT